MFATMEIPLTLPNPNDRLPQSYTSASARPGIQRPVAVSILASLGILVGSALLFCNAIAMAANAIMLAHPQRSIPMNATIPQDPLVMKFGAANAIAGAILGAILLGGCLAAISMRRRARRGMLVWSVAFILCGLARTIGEIKYVGPANLAWVKENKPDDPTFASGQMAAMLVPKAIGMLAFYCVLPALFLAFWTRKEVKEAFERSGSSR
jgi:hypothetical protein